MKPGRGTREEFWRQRDRRSALGRDELARRQARRVGAAGFVVAAVLPVVLWHRVIADVSSECQHELFRRLNSSLSFDWRLAPYDVAQSRAHVGMLAERGIIEPGDRDALVEALATVERELDDGSFPFREEDEDIHLAIERRVT